MKKRLAISFAIDLKEGKEQPHKLKQLTYIGCETT